MTAFNQLARVSSALCFCVFSFVEVCAQQTAQSPSGIDALEESIRKPATESKLLKRDVANKTNSDITALAFAGNGSRLAVAYASGDLVVWDTKTLNEVSRAPKDLRGYNTSVAMNDDGSWLLAGGPKDKGAIILNAVTGEKIGAMKGNENDILRIAVTPDQKYLVTCTKKGGIRRELRDRNEDAMQASDPEQEFAILDISRDGTSILLGEGAKKAELITAFFPTDKKEATYYTSSFTSDKPILQATFDTKFVYSSLKTSELRISHVVKEENAGKEETESVHDLALRCRLPRFMSVTADEKFLVLGGSDQTLEYRPLLAPFASWHAPKLSDRELRAFAMTPDGRKIALGNAGGELKLVELSELPVVPMAHATEVLHSLRDKKQYSELEELLKRFERDSDSLIWMSNGSPYDMLAHLVLHNNGLPQVKPNLDAELEEWSKAKPDSRLVKLLRAKRFISHAWRARGPGLANTVTEEGWRTFHANIEKAREILVPLCDEKDPPPCAYQHLFHIAKAESWPKERWQPYADRLMKEAPGYLDAHFAIMEMLMPRWGGEPEDCESYAKQVADQLGGPDGDALYARMVIAHMPYYSAPTFFEQTGMDYERARRGLWHLSQGSHRIYAKHQGLKLAFTHKDLKGASVFLKAMSPAEETAWQPRWWRSEDDFQMARRFVLTQ